MTRNLLKKLELYIKWVIIFQIHAMIQSHTILKSMAYVTSNPNHKSKVYKTNDIKTKYKIWIYIKYIYIYIYI